MADDTDPKSKQPGEKPEGKFHYNPGNMSQKTVESVKPEAEQHANEDRKQSRAPSPKERGA